MQTAFSTLGRSAFTAFALAASFCACADSGWRVTAIASPPDISRDGLRQVLVAVADPNGKSVVGLNKSSFLFKTLRCSEPQTKDSRSVCNYVDATLGGGNTPEMEATVTPGLYILHVLGGGEGNYLALRVLRPFAPAQIPVGGVGLTEAQLDAQREQRQMALIIVPLDKQR